MKKKRLRILKARHSGFCFGVKRAIGIAEGFLDKKKKAYSLGEIIHNPVVVKELSQRGLKVICDIKKAEGAHIVIRSHGISPRLREKAKRLSIGMIDATCPFVKRSHTIVTLLKKDGYTVVIAGERDHPEVKALSEVAGKGSIIVSKQSDLKKLEFKRIKKIAAVAQTTLSRDQFLKIAASIFKLNCLEFRIFNTICNDVLQRQTEAKELAKKVDIALVIGGKMSANTKHLAKICKDSGAKTYHIETEKELKNLWFKNKGSVGVISGASTPSEIVDRVVLKLNSHLSLTCRQA